VNGREWVEMGVNERVGRESAR